jgi:hypothetical protein
MFIYLLRPDSSYSALTYWYVEKEDELLPFAEATFRDFNFVYGVEDKVEVSWADSKKKTRIVAKGWIEPEDWENPGDPDSEACFSVVVVAKFKPLKKKES